MHGDSDWMNFIYLGILLVFIASSLFARRDINIKKALGYLGIWSLIALIAIILYSFRHSFVDFRGRVAAEIFPSKAVINDSGQIVIASSQGGHFYVNTKVNGVPIRFMVDTGASDISISMSDAKRIGIDVSRLNFNKPYQTANGTSYGASIVIDSIDIAGAKFYNVRASVNSGNMGTSLLGMSMLRKFRKYEFYQDRLYLTR